MLIGCVNNSVCGNVICRSCLIKCKNKCPHCQAVNIIATNCPRPILKMLDALQIQCTKCLTIMERDRYSTHLRDDCELQLQQTECIKKIIPCKASNVKCKWQGVRQDYEKHISTCAYVELSSELISLHLSLANARVHTTAAETSLSLFVGNTPQSNSSISLFGSQQSVVSTDSINEWRSRLVLRVR